MSLFQQTILKKQIALNSEQISAAYKKYVAYFHNPEIQENIRKSKEEKIKGEFIRKLFVDVFGYIPEPEPNFNLRVEQKNEKDSKKADAAILVNGIVKAVIEIKDLSITDLKQIEIQAFGYKNNQRNASYVITSNFGKLRFYIENAIDYKEFNLFSLTEEEFAVLWLCLAYENIAKDLPKQLKSESVHKEEQITKQFYADYSAFKRVLFENIQRGNPSFDKLVLFRKTQKLLDRFLFIFFAEDKGLLPPNSMNIMLEDWAQRKKDILSEYQSLYDRFKIYFHFLNIGRKPIEGKGEIFEYNGGLFKPDEILNAIKIDDNILNVYIQKIAAYDFDTDVDVNILGHIFEHSLTEIEEITNELSNKGFKPLVKPLVDTLAVSKRKKDGVFYTPRYITHYIVENTIGKLCADKRKELNIDESEYFTDENRLKTTTLQFEQKLFDYRNWLFSLTICDPACGSGAFLNAALDFLMTEHRLIDEMYAKISDVQCPQFDNIANTILENNLFGVDINEESVEIAKLALWLRTAMPHRKLNSLNDNIKCGNSLISPTLTTVTRGLNPLLALLSDPLLNAPLSMPEIDKAFDWHKEFPQVFKEKDKKAFHVTTAIHDSRTSDRMVAYKVRQKRFMGTMPDPQVYPLDEEDEFIITKTILEIVNEDKLNVLAYNICCDHLHILLVCEIEELDKIVKKIKGKTARVYNSSKGMNPLVKKEGERSIPLWTQKFGHNEIFDQEQLYNTIEYIQNNRIKHELPTNKGIHPLVKEMCCNLEHAFRLEYKGGFDVVIGNPPYVLCQPSNTPENILKYYKQFEVASYKIDLFHLFFEQGIKLLKLNGKLGFITPNTYLTNKYIKPLRKFILDNTAIDFLVQHDEGVFADVSVDVASIILNKQKKVDNSITIQKSTNNLFEMTGIKKQDEWSNDKDCIFNIKSDFELNLSDTISLGEVCNTYFGIQAFDRKSSISNIQENENFLNIIDGGDIFPYSYAISTKYFNYIESNIKSGGDWNVYKQDRIVVRQIGQIPIVGMCKKDILASNTLYSIYSKTTDYHLNYILCLLNSSVIKKYWISKYSDSKQLFPKIKGYQLRELPIIKLSISEQQPYITLADKMLSLSSELQTKRQTFLRRLSDNFSVTTNKGIYPLATAENGVATTKNKGIYPLVITRALERFDELDFKQFLAELKKQKITLSLKQQDEWDEYFNEYKAECNDLVKQVEETDREIDVLVYGLYGLTEEEVKIIEEHNK